MSVFCLLFVSGCSSNKKEEEKKKPANNSAGLELITGSEGEMKKISESGDLSLYVDAYTGIFEVRSNDGSKVWSSNPVDRETDKIANEGVQKMNLNSTLLFNFVDLDTNTERTTTNTYTKSVAKEATKCYKIENGFRIEYTIPGNANTMVPLEITLSDNILTATIPTDEIYEGKDEMLSQISVLPYFSAAGLEDEGYILVPDGSGAIIYYNNEKSNFGDYSQAVYGKDYAQLSEYKDNVSNSLRLPVFGLSGKYFASIDSGTAHSSVNAATSGTKNSYNYAYASFQLRSRDTYLLGNTEISRFSEEIEDIGDLVVNYYLMDEDDGYNEMAELYSELIYGDKTIEKDDNSPFFLQLIGASKYETSFAGIPITKSKKLTGYAQAQDLLTELREAINGEIVFKYIADKKSVMSEYPTSFKWDSSLGSKSQRNELLNYCEENDITLVTDVNIFTYKNQTLTTLFWNNTASTLSGKKVYQCFYNLSTRKIDYNEDPSYFAKLSSVSNWSDKLIKSMKKENLTSISMENFGRIIYSDFDDDDTISRAEAQEEIIKIAEKYSEAFETRLFSDVNSYMLPYATILEDVPSESSGYTLIDADVPFYQLVLNGRTVYSVPAINKSASENRAFLKTIESGSALKYTLMAEEILALRDTDLEKSYYLSPTEWKEHGKELYKELNTLYTATDGFEISKHTVINKEVRLVEYDNGKSIYINYSENPYTLENGTEVPAGDYLLVE